MIVSRGLYQSNYKQKGLKSPTREWETWQVGVGARAHRRAEAQARNPKSLGEDEPDRPETVAGTLYPTGEPRLKPGIPRS